jgi:hypothetical protein
MTLQLVRTEPDNGALTVGGSVDPFSAYADAVAPRNIVGKLLKFSKGDYLAGEEMEPVPVGTIFTVNADELLVGWIKWLDSKPAEQRMVRLSDGQTPAKREELGDEDKSNWEADSTGKPRDPWQFTNYLPLLSETGELFTFTASSRGGINAIAVLCRRYGQHRRRHPDVHPMIALDVDAYQHRDFGRIKFPRLTPAGWAPKAKFNEAMAAAGLAVAEAAPIAPDPADEMSDEIPF